MIENERQYQITQSAVQEFRSAIGLLESKPDPETDPLLVKAELDGLRSQYHELEQELSNYEASNEGHS